MDGNENHFATESVFSPRKVIQAITEPSGLSAVDSQLSTRVKSRRFPYPFSAALAICSDLDETPDADTYFELMRFLNTTDDTSMGPGVGLEVGNSIYFDMPPGHFSYWNTDDKNREKIRALIK